MAYIRNMNKQQGILLWRQQGAAFQVYRTFFLSVHSYSSYVLFHVIEILVETHTGVNIRPWSESWVNSLREVNYCQLLSRTSCFVCSGLGSCSPGWFCNSCSWRDVTTLGRILWVLEHSHCVFVALGLAALGLWAACAVPSAQSRRGKLLATGWSSTALLPTLCFCQMFLCSSCWTQEKNPSMSDFNGQLWNHLTHSATRLVANAMNMKYLLPTQKLPG